MMKGTLKRIILILVLFNFSFPAFATDDMDRVSTKESQEQQNSQ